MADITGATGQEGVTPPVSPTGKETPPTSSWKEMIEKGEIPYHELLEVPSVREFFDRQVEKKTSERLAQQPIVTKEAPNVLDQVANDLSNEFQLTPSQAKKLAGSMETIVTKTIEKSLGSIQGNIQRISLNQKVQEFGITHQDLPQYQKKMNEIFVSLSPEEQTFIVNAPSGLEFLYSKAKLSSPTQTPNPWGGTSNRGGSPPKIEVKTEAVEAAKALSAGDRESYERIMASLNK